jgi:RND superfamily putative drug exporter
MAHHARWFIAAWIVLAVLGFGAVGGALGNQSLFDRLQADDAPQVPGGAKTGTDLLATANPSGPTVQLLLDGVDPASLTVRAAVLDAAQDVAAIPHVRSVSQPYVDTHGVELPADKVLPKQAFWHNPLVSTDSRALLVVAQLAPGLSAETKAVTVKAVEDRFDEVPRGLPGATARIGGIQALVDEINHHVQTDLQIGEAVAIPLSLVVMIVVFGGLLAAGLPIVGAIASIAGGLLSLLGFSYTMGLSSTVPSVVSVLGLGLCIDYGLLLVSRYREELRRLHDAGNDTPSPEALEGALEHTLGTAGRTILFSAVTVAISICGLMFFHATILRAIGAAGVSVVVVALLVALTLVPALLAVAGDRMIRPGVTQRVWGLRRFTRRLGDVAPEHGAFSRLAHAVQRRPAFVALGVGAFLVAAGSPVLDMRLANSGYEMLPTSSPQRQLFQAVVDRFPATAEAPVIVVSHAPAARLQAWGENVVTKVPWVRSVDPVREVGTGADRVSVMGVRSTAGERGPLVEQVARDVANVHPEFDTYVTGMAAHNAAFLDDLRARAPIAVGIVVLATFVLLFLMTGSVLIPAKALVMNVVSLGASFGVLVWVFQEGNLEGLLRFTSAGGIDTTIPALVLSFAFGLSMDYEVFLLSRIKETRDAGAGNDAAVAGGLQRSGRIITSAALIVVIVFAGFATGQLLVIKEMGVALAVAVAVDATLVRTLLVPATMTLLGEWNWWAPKPLRLLHERFGVREG